MSVIDSQVPAFAAVAASGTLLVALGLRLALQRQ